MARQLFEAAPASLHPASAPQPPQLPQPQQRPPWAKILYRRQPYADNYTDQSFLEGMIRNAHVHAYDYWDLVEDAFGVAQQVAVVACFGCIFYFTHLERVLDEVLLSLLGFVLFVGGYAAVRLTNASLTMSGFIIYQDASTLVLVAIVLLSLSPVLSTLTGTFSDDTVFALSFFLLGLNVCLHDYNYTNNTTSVFHATVSINAAIYAAVVLASRLSSSLLVFAFLGSAILLFCLFPVIRHHVKKHSVRAHRYETVVLVVAALVMQLRISRTLSFVYVVINVIIVFVCPYWLISVQQYKNAINGPWDVVDLSKSRPD
eukprot:gnl/Spiro4/18483_TR9896_c0_g1_i1.p1 gnl/Spiro4/18483_TR9896_c0_g1~~gnl/Spiro4/18483_TR9896_c0_g1_i1.p1  ORF type:complete len:346 (+),score=92.28 gnl/Spiro4/18483_TR9896_c0_g1_i1:91-1038(+)